MGEDGGASGSYYYRNVLRLDYSTAVPTASITPSVTSGSGTITPASKVDLPSGGSTNFAINASAHWHISSIATNGVVVYSNSGSLGITSTNFSWANVTGAGNTIAVTFAMDEYTLNVASAWGTPTPTAGAHVYDYGSSLSCSVTTPYVQGGTQRVCTGWTGSGNVSSGSGASTTFSLTTNSSITWLWAKTNYSLTLQTSGSGVISVGTNGWYTSGGSVSLTATPSAYWSFANWTGTGLTGSDTNPNLSVTMNQARTITANFTVPQYKLVVTSAQGSCFPATGTNTLNYGVCSCYVTESPKVVGGSTQYICTGWTGNGSVTPGSGTNTMFVLGADSSITWQWTKTNYWLSVVTSNYGTVTGATNGWYTNGASVVLTASNAPHCSFVNWTGSGLSGSDTGLTLSLTMNQARFVTANYSNDQYKLVVTSERGGCVPAAGTNTLNYGPVSCSVTNSPQVTGGGTQFVCTGWTGSGNAGNGADTNTTFTLGTNSSISWLWTKYHLLSVQTTGDGTVTGGTNGWYTNGASLVLTAVPSFNRYLVNWTGTDLDGSDSNQTLSVTLNKARSVTANFASYPGIWLVKSDATGANDGSSWSNAFTNIQYAISASVTNDQIWVAAGTYRPTTNPANRSATFSIPYGVTLLGGFAGNETNLSQRNYSTNITILSGDILGNDLDAFVNHTENVYHVATVCDGATLDGCTVYGGYADGAGNDLYGGGVFFSGGGTIRNCTIVTNYADSGGGCYMNGGGVAAACSIRGNKAGTYGGGLYLSTPGIVTNCTIDSNDGGSDGGGVYLNAGGLVTHSIISRNTVTTRGGGVRCLGGGKVKNSVIFRNFAGSNGGGACATTVGAFEHCTIASNRASTSGGGVYFLSNGGILSNSIVYYNFAPTASNCTSTGSSIYRYVCTFPTLAGGTGVITNNPQFANILLDDFHLKSAGGRWVPSLGLWTNDMTTSPCIDAGDTSAQFACEPAPNGARVNLGAFGNTPEASKTPGVTFVLTVQGGGHGSPSPSGTSTWNLNDTVNASMGGSPEPAGVLTQYVCTGWVRTGSTPGSGSGTNTSFTVTNTTSLTWLWATNYWLAATAAANGLVDATNQWLRAASNVTITATPSTYYHFGAWSGDTNNCTISSNRVTAPMTRPRQITASFVANVVTNNTPEWWLAGFGLPVNNAGALYDDGDGVPAWAEYVADTDPTNKQSFLAITNITVGGAGACIHWKGGIAATQYLETRRSLSSTSEQWVVVFTNVPPTSTFTNRVDATGSTTGRFFRVRVTR